MTDLPLSVFRHLLNSVPEEMGVALRNSAVSPNIKERLDFSCALLDATGRLVAHAAHIPVHLGSAHLTVPAVLGEFEPAAGDVVILNDPHRGGTHLNDVTVLAPLHDAHGRRLGFLLNRAHHADIGGAEPGSLAGARDLYGEGLILPPVHLYRAGEAVPEVWRLFEANTRDPRSRRADLRAQVAALRRGAERLRGLEARFGAAALREAMDGLLAHGERLVRTMLAAWPEGEACAADALDGPGTPEILLRLHKEGDTLLLDFSGSSPQVPGSWNTHRAVTWSSIFYVLQALSPDELPETSGTLAPIRLELPEASVVSSRAPAGVAVGNVETSQRLVDVLLLALDRLLPGRVPAASQGTMNNLTFGAGGAVYYETLGGGAGGGPAGPGASGVQVHMTNTRNTPVEVLEDELPVRILRLELRQGSGGPGRHPGGEGLLKEFEFLAPVRLAVTATRRRSAPPGLRGGGAGRPGCERVCAAPGGTWRSLGPGETVDLAPGARLVLETPGGGGWGEAEPET